MRFVAKIVFITLLLLFAMELHSIPGTAAAAFTGGLTGLAVALILQHKDTP